MRQLRKQRTNRADLSNPNGSVSYAASGRHIVACVVMIVRVWRECVSVLWGVSQGLQMSVLFVVICPMPLVCGGVRINVVAVRFERFGPARRRRRRSGIGVRRVARLGGRRDDAVRTGKLRDALCVHSVVYFFAS